MIVYGDPSSRTTPAELSGELAQQTGTGQTLCLDSLRRLLVLVGQMEQAVFDSEIDSLKGEAVNRTDLLAQSFVKCHVSGAPQTVPVLPQLDGSEELTVKIPEGFSFYALYPESYIAAAQDWCAHHPSGSAVVIGIRSIGTTLSAVVLASLRAQGRDATRFTVRPTGHPFAREATIQSDRVCGVSHCLIVDEGPGLSGSSMASVAVAVEAAGVPKSRIAFFPGHAAEPGCEASDETRTWWRSVSRYVGTRSADRSLLDHLGAATELKLGSPVVETADLGGGKWRHHLLHPPLTPTYFERAKFKVATASAGALLWKFAGFLRPDAVQGYCASRWVEGEPMHAADVTAARVEILAEYLKSRSHTGSGRSRWEQEESRARLAAMSLANVGELVRPLLEAASWKDDASEYCDGRMALYEWIVSASGEIQKVDRDGNVPDHSVVGRQSMLWDVAGAIVEWGLTDDFASGFDTPIENLPFYLGSYAAFKFGQFMFCASMAHGHERRELEREAGRYKDWLASYVATGAAGSRRFH